MLHLYLYINLKDWANIWNSKYKLIADLQSIHNVIYARIIKRTNSGPNSQSNVLNPLPAISGHASFL